MDKLYRFSPIRDEKTLREAINYIATQTTALCKKITGKEFQIEPLTIFSHYQAEFEYLKSLLLTIGKFDNDKHHGLYVRLNEPIQLPHNTLTLLRVRQPDPYRMQVGCDDFIISDVEKFKQEYLDAHPFNLRVIDRPDMEMIEFYDPDFDVLAYITTMKDQTANIVN